MAKNTKATPAVPPPPLPATAHHTEGTATLAAASVPVVDVSGVLHEAHPVGTAQYIAELEAEAEQHLAELQALKGRVTEGFKGIATAAITHAAQMAGHLPQDINAIPGIDAINAAGGAPQ